MITYWQLDFLHNYKGIDSLFLGIKGLVVIMR